MKKILSVFLALFLTFSLCACGGKGESGTTNNQDGTTSVASSDTEIYFLNFKPESASVFEEIAVQYQKETGVKVKVVTAASDTYEQTLTSEITKSNPPTIFIINGPVGYQNWKKYCADLSDSRLYNLLIDTELAIADGEGVYGLPLAIEGYGIIYNEDITDKYFALTDKGTSYTSMDEIRSFNALRELAEDMQAHKEELGIDGVFASTSFSSGNQWRWNTHLLNIPYHLEMSENENYTNSTLAGLDSKEFTFKYSGYFKNIFDLYLDNSVTQRGLIGSKSVSDAMAEFALGKAAMVQNGNWAYSEIEELNGNTVDEDDVKMLPIYMGAEGEENQGLCVGTETYLAINSAVSEEKQKASEDFLVWLFTSDTGIDYVTDDLGFIAPYTTFEDNNEIDDPLSKEVLSWMSKKNIETIPWAFTAFPSLEFKEEVSSALLEYAQGTGQWEDTAKKISQAYSKAKTAS